MLAPDYILLLVFDVIGLIGASISLGYLGLKLQLDGNTKTVLTTLGLLNFGLLLTSALSGFKMILNQQETLEDCALLIRPVFYSAGLGNSLLTFLISALQYWKTAYQVRRLGNFLVTFGTCISLFFTLLIFTVVNLAYFSSMPELEQLPPFSEVYECAYPNIITSDYY